MSGADDGSTRPPTGGPPTGGSPLRADDPSIPPRPPLPEPPASAPAPHATPEPGEGSQQPTLRLPAEPSDGSQATLPLPPGPAGGTQPTLRLPSHPALPFSEPSPPSTRLPGAPRTAFTQPPTAPLDVSTQSATGPSVDMWSLADGEPPPWQVTPEPVPQRRGVGGWALAFSIAGLLASFFVGWGFPLALVGIIAGGVALARPPESRPAAAWAIALGVLALVYSAGWLLWAAGRLTLFG